MCAPIDPAEPPAYERRTGFERENTVFRVLSLEARAHMSMLTCLLNMFKLFGIFAVPKIKISFNASNNILIAGPANMLNDIERI